MNVFTVNRQLNSKYYIMAKRKCVSLYLKEMVPTSYVFDAFVEHQIIKFIKSLENAIYFTTSSELYSNALVRVFS